MNKHIHQGLSVFKQTLHELQQNWIISLVNKFVILFVVLSLAIIVLNYSSYPPGVPLYYSKPWGTERLAHPASLLLLPLSALFWHGINILLSTYETKRYITFTQILFLTSFIVSFLSFIIVLRVTTMIL